MRQDEIGQIAEAVYKRFKENALGEINARFDKLDERFDGIENHLDRQDDDLKQVKKSVEHISGAWDNWQGAV